MSFIKKQNILNIQLNYFIVAIFSAVFFFAHTAHAATLSVSPSSGQYSVGKTFSVRVVVGSGGQSVNAVSGQVSFSNDTLNLVGISKSGIVTLWAQDPTYSNASGTASFQGVILNGYSGGAGTVLTLTFKAIAQGTGTVSIASSRSSVLLNDGQGTNVLSGTSGGSFVIGPGTTPPPATTHPSTATIPVTPTTVVTSPVPSATGTPLFTAYESPLLPSNFVVVKGTAGINSPITIMFTQALGNGTSTVTEHIVQTNDAGVFTFVSDEKVVEGNTYTLQAVTPDGQHTDPLVISVKNSLGYTLVTFLAAVAAIKISAVLALLILILVSGYLLYRNYVLKKRLKMGAHKL